ncbi:MAG: hypothetical protein KDB22_28215 [Planctomycetales bacterium]|nr:hypothetical protein [Planctomycetales bacterium]
MMGEKHMVTIETEKAGKMEFTPDQFEMFLQCAMVGAEGYPVDNDDIDLIYDMVNRALEAIRA